VAAIAMKAARCSVTRQTFKQEAIQGTTGDYLELLERMVKQGRQRHDPTLAIAISVEALGRLVAEVRGSRDLLRAQPADAIGAAYLEMQGRHIALGDALAAEKQRVARLLDVVEAARWIASAEDEDEGGAWDAAHAELRAALAKLDADTAADTDAARRERIQRSGRAVDQAIEDDYIGRKP
jgi:hypothetical protein